MKALNHRGMAVFFVLPCVLSALTAATGKLTLFLLYLASLLLSVAVTPGFRGRENRAMFAVLAVSSIPADLCTVLYALKTDFMRSLSQDMAVIGFLWGVLLYALLFSLEQVAMGVVTRALWPSQFPASGTAEQANE